LLERTADRSGRLVKHRERQRLVRGLRRIAGDAIDPNLMRRRHDVLLRYRAAAVRYELLEIAALLEQAQDPEPACVNAIRELLANGDSPLYHPGVHISELYAALYYIRAGLARNHTHHQSLERPRLGAVHDEGTNR
jgi:hypothetical protein